MPELPEVEVLRRSLAHRLPGERIARVEVHDPRLRERVRRQELAERCEGRRIERVGRRAKYLLIDVEGGSTVVIHLGMSGRLTVASAGTDREVHEHVAFHLSSGNRLRFRDPRRFGLTLALPTAELAADRHFSHLGREPLEGNLLGEDLRRLARGRRAPIKSFLMDARIVVGVGNIYASEALFHAGIHPTRSVARISMLRWEGLAAAVRSVLGAAIEQGGTTLNDFADGAGRDGYFQVSLVVYGREGESCRRCEGTIRRFVQSGRSTFYCPQCQH